jgi:flagellar basal-body rod protein FlgB
MKIDLMHDPTIDAMSSYMTRLSKRQQVIASNIANIDTPGYKTKDVSFHATMAELLSEQTAPAATRRPERDGVAELRFSALEPEVFEVPGLPAQPDGNNVGLDQEMLKLSETSFGYSTIAQLLRLKFRTIASSINEGRTG